LEHDNEDQNGEVLCWRRHSHELGFPGGIADHCLYRPEAGEKAKISMSQARSIALKAHPGKITDEELERERGGSGLRYSFDIKSGGITQEVGVDAKTGKVLENAKEGPHPH
jgi:uncharacterized membrane protein YkoI